MHGATRNGNISICHQNGIISSANVDSVTNQPQGKVLSNNDKILTVSNHTIANKDGELQCHICHKSYQSPVQLKRHLRRHAEDKKHSCPFCKKGFSDQFDLKRHVRIHTGIKPFSCKRCSRAFAQRCSLELHCQKAHGADVSRQYLILLAYIRAIVFNVATYLL